MLLYRARTIDSRPRRAAPHQGNEPAVRVRGRWFTSDLSAAIAHRATLDGESEIVAVDVPDAVAECFRVEVTPVTQCGIDAGAHSAHPATDYVLPMFRVMDATGVSADARGRMRDVIDVNAPSPASPRRIRDAVLPLAA